MKICIIGAGAIGGMLAARMAGGGVAVSLLARGANLRAIRERGLRLVDRAGERSHDIPASDRAADFGVQDCVVIATKAHAIPALLDAIAPLLGPDTAVASAVNGIPWWYFHGCEAPGGHRHLDSVDPGGAIWNAIGPERAIGCVVYVAAAAREPGLIAHSHGGRFILGEPTGEDSPRVRALAEAIAAGGLKAPVSPDIRHEVWAKLWGNLNANPLSALTGAPMEALIADPRVRQVMIDMAREGQAVAQSLGIALDGDPVARVDEMRGLGTFRTSMLQDMDAGKPIELDPILGAIAELGRATGIATPTLDTVYALTRQRAELAGCYVPLTEAKADPVPPAA